MDKQARELRKKSNDKIYTPKPVAIKMIEMCEIKNGEKVLDCCRGGGVFYDNLPESCFKYYCEIDEGKDYFDETEKYDLIIGNPPYSKWNKWIKHTVKLTDKFCFIFGVINLTDARLNNIFKHGYGLTKFHLLKLDWWFSPSCIYYLKK